jgi:hypothetical protein
MTDYGYGLVQIVSGDTIYDFGTVTSITDSLNKSISAIPIVSLTTDSTFALESETSNQYSISFVRRTLYKEDGSLYTINDPGYDIRAWMWPNDLWQDRVISLINRWQARNGGYTMWINHNLDENGEEITGVENGQSISLSKTSLFPRTTCNVFIKTISFNLKAGDTDTIQGSMTVIVGGLSTTKQESAATGKKNTTDVSYELVCTGSSASKGICSQPRYCYKTVNGQIAYGFPTRDSGTVISPIPIYVKSNDKWIVDSGYTIDRVEQVNGKEQTVVYNYITYNQINEYNEYVGKDEKFCTAEFISSSGDKFALMLMKGRDDSSAEQHDYEKGYEDAIDAVESVTLTGGPQNPFEKIQVVTSYKRLTAAYGEISVDGWFSDGDGLTLKPGESQIRYAGAGLGRYTCTAYQVKDSTISLEGHAEAAVLASCVTSGVIAANGPFRLVSDMIGTSKYGLTTPFDNDTVISNVDTDLYSEEYIKIAAGQNVWTVLQYLAYMLHARIFFTGRYAYLINYSTLFTVDETSNTTDPNWRFNRLIIRDILDKGQSILAGEGGIDPLSDMSNISLECHNTNPRSRISSRINGTVDSPRSSEQNVTNAVEVTYIEGGSTKTIGVARYVDNEDNSVYGPYTKSDGAYDVYQPGVDDEVCKRAKRSVEAYGEKKESIDLKQVFAHLPTVLAWEIVRTILDYKLEDHKEVSVNVMESYSAQTTTDADENQVQTTSTWSAMFPTVCELQRLTDIEQDLIVSSESPFGEGGGHDWRPEKLYLASYTHKYPDYMSTYTFGTPMSTTLAASINGQNVKISALASSVRQ